MSSRPSQIPDSEIISDSEFPDDLDMATAILSKEEVAIKERIWVHENRDYLRTQQARRLRQELAELAVNTTVGMHIYNLKNRHLPTHFQGTKSPGSHLHIPRECRQVYMARRHGINRRPSSSISVRRTLRDRPHAVIHSDTVYAVPHTSPASDVNSQQ